jgi:outer membrane receptor protein involved in Fe transport
MGMKLSRLCLAGAIAVVPSAAPAEVFKLDPIEVQAPLVHPSRQIRATVDEAFDAPRSTSYVNGSIIQNLNPVNKMDSVRYNATGLISEPGSGNRFGGGTKIRTFGDWGAALSIDGLPAFKTAGQEGGGYTNTLIPSIAIDRIGVVKGGRAVQYGDGTDGGVIDTAIKSGRGYKDHTAVSLDASTAGEGIGQGEAADSTDRWDYYLAGSGLYAQYNGDPETLDEQSAYGLLGKGGWNFSNDTRAEFLGISDRTRPDIFRNGQREEVKTMIRIASGTVDHRMTDRVSLRAGHLYTDSRSQWRERNRDRGLSNRITFLDGYLTRPVTDSVDYAGSAGIEHKYTNLLRDNQYDADFNDVSAKLSNAFTFDRNLVLTAGLRFTWFNNDVSLNGAGQPDTLGADMLWSYETGAAYSVLENTRLRASVASGYNRFFEKYGNFGADALNTQGAGDEVVESISYEVGLNQGWKGGSFDVAAYYIKQDNVPRRSGGAIESVTVEQTGLEVEVNSMITEKLSISGGYMRVLDVTVTRADGSDANTNIFFDGQAASVPENQFNMRLDYQVTGDWSLWGMAYRSTGYESIAANGTVQNRRPFTRIDLGTAWRPAEKTAVRFRVENVLDEKDFGSTLDSVPVDETGKLGRVFWVGLDQSF